MTPAQVDERILLSRRTLTHYVKRARAGDWPHPDTLPMISEELAILAALGEEHPSKVAKLVKMVSEWIAYRDELRRRQN